MLGTPENRTVTICYELIESINRNSPATVSKEGITRRETIVGSIMMVIARNRACHVRPLGNPDPRT